MEGKGGGRGGGRERREEEVVHACSHTLTFRSDLTAPCYTPHTHLPTSHIVISPLPIPTPPTPHLDGITKTISLCPHFINDATDEEPEQLALGGVHHHHGNVEQVKTHEPQQCGDHKHIAENVFSQ